MLRSVTPDWAAVRGLMIDLDGVVYMGREPIAGAAGFLGEARRRGLPFLLVTNNSTTSPELVAERLRGMHIEVETARDPDQRTGSGGVRPRAQRGQDARARDWRSWVCGRPPKPRGWRCSRTARRTSTGSWPDSTAPLTITS